MTKPKMFEKPSGVRDYLPAAVARLRRIERQALECMARWGYSQIVTPTMEFYETVGAASATSDHKLFKLLNQRGTTMVLRSDMTAPIARVVSSLLQKEPFPIRLSYHANVFRSMEEEAGRDAEFYQTGAELVGDGSPEADAEVIALSIACLKAAGVDCFKIAVGHHQFLEGLFEYLLPGRVEEQRSLQDRLVHRDVVGYREMVQSLALAPELNDRLLDILRLRGGESTFIRAKSLSNAPLVQSSLAHLEKVWEVLKAYGVSEHLILDLTMVGDFSYYTGLIFEGYSDDLGFPVMSGGRYDNLLQQFGRSAPATGFALKTSRLLDVVQRVEEQDDHDPILVQYDSRSREVAFAEALRLRENGNIVITRRVEDATELDDIVRDEDHKLWWSGKRLKDVLTFVRFIKEHV